MLVDLVPAFNEIDLFVVRYNELKDIVDRFVIVEASHTHSGSHKPYYFTEFFNQEILDDIHTAFNDDKIHVLRWDCSRIPAIKEYAWYRENMQREVLGYYIKENCAPTDICMLSDLDEIPRAKAVESILDDPSFHGIWYFEQVLSYLFMNTTQGVWGGTKIFYADTVDMTIDRFMTNHIRYRDQFDGVIRDGGWHMSSLGNLDHVNNKLRNYAHCLDCAHIGTSSIQDSLDNLTDPFNKNPLTLVNIATLPQYVQDNIKYYIGKGYIYGES